MTYCVLNLSGIKLNSPLPCRVAYYLCELLVHAVSWPAASEICATGIGLMEIVPRPRLQQLGNAVVRSIAAPRQRRIIVLVVLNRCMSFSVVGQSQDDQRILYLFVIDSLFLVGRTTRSTIIIILCSSCLTTSFIHRRHHYCCIRCRRRRRRRR